MTLACFIRGFAGCAAAIGDAQRFEAAPFVERRYWRRFRCRRTFGHGRRLRMIVAQHRSKCRTNPICRRWRRPSPSPRMPLPPARSKRGPEFVVDQPAPAHGADKKQGGGDLQQIALQRLPQRVLLLASASCRIRIARGRLRNGRARAHARAGMIEPPAQLCIQAEMARARQPRPPLWPVYETPAALVLGPYLALFPHPTRPVSVTTMSPFWRAIGWPLVAGGEQKRENPPESGSPTTPWCSLSARFRLRRVRSAPYRVIRW